MSAHESQLELPLIENICLHICEDQIFNRCDNCGLRLFLNEDMLLGSEKERIELLRLYYFK